MKFLTARYDAVSVGSPSVLIQHYEYKGEQICFACIAERDDMTERLYQWFREEMLGRFLRKLRCDMKRTEQDLRRILKEAMSGLACEVEEKISVALLLCKGEEFLALERGCMRILCFNTAFGKSHMRYLLEKDEGDFCYGSFGEDVAWLLATDTFFEGVGEALLREVLFVGEIKQEWQIEKRLRELVWERCPKKLGDTGALLVRSCGEVAFDKGMSNQQRRIFEEVPGGNLGWNDTLHLGFVWGEKIGEGAFARVLKVKERQSGQTYACKMSRNISMLWREYCAGKMLEHPLFPKMYDFWQDGEYGYLLMEYVPGNTLKSMLERRGHFTVRQTIFVGMELAEGLLYLHEQAGVLFQDVKPENIMIRQDGRVKLLDLGCVCKRGTTAAFRAGTPGFGAPEQFVEGSSPDVTCDVYGLARTMEEMLGPSGKREKRLKNLLKYCRSEEPKRRIPDMRLLLNLLGGLTRGKKGTKPFYKPGVLCHKNIWERSYKTLDVS